MSTADNEIERVYREMMSGGFQSVDIQGKNDGSLLSVVTHTLAALETGRTHEALEGAGQALAFAQNAAHPPQMRGWAVWLAGVIEGLLSEPDASVLCMQRAQRLFEEAQCLGMSTWCRGFSARIVSEMGDTAQSIQMYETLVGGTGFDTDDTGGSHLFSGRLQYLKANFEAAMVRLERAHHAFVTQGLSLLATEALVDMAWVAAGRGQFTDAARLFTSSLAAFSGMGASYRFHRATCDYAVVQQWSAVDDGGTVQAVMDAVASCEEGDFSVPPILRFWEIWGRANAPSQRAEQFHRLLKESTHQLNKPVSILCHLGLLETCPPHDMTTRDFHLGRIHALLVQYTQPDRNIAVIAEWVADRLFRHQNNALNWRALRVLELAHDQWLKLNAADGLARIDHALTVWHHAETGFCLGTYDFVHRIAKGPFGESWHGRVSRSGEPVILRVMNARALPRRGVQRSVSETIDRLSRLHHPSLVKTLGSETATAFTERATQRSIREGTMILVSAARPNFKEHIPTLNDDLFDTVCAVLQGLAALHQAGFLHLSLNPDSIWHQTTSEGRTVSVSDYVLPDLLRAAMGGRWSPAEFPFLAPEQGISRDGTVGPWSDLYSLGLIVYWWMTGRRYDPQEDSVVRLHHDGPEGLTRWLSLLLAAEPSRRFQSASDALAVWWAVFGEHPKTLHEDAGLDDIVDVDQDATREIMVSRDLVLEESPTEVVSQRTSHQGGIQDAITDVTIQVDAAFAEDTKTLAGSVGTASRNEWGRNIRPPTQWHRVYPETGPVVDPEHAMDAFVAQDTPMFGRHGERDALWTALWQACVKEERRICTIEGAPGLGKTRLARWFQDAVLRWGGADVLRCTARDPNTLARTLAKSILVQMGCYGRRTPQILASVARAFPNQSDVYHHTLSQHLAIQSGMSVDEGGLHPKTLSVLMDAVCLLAAHRPLVLILLDYEPGCGCTAILGRMRALRRRLVVVVVDGDGLFSKEVVPDVQCVLTPFSHRETMDLIRSQIPLRFQLVEELATRAEGYPAFIARWLEEWIHRGDLCVEHGQLRARPRRTLDGPLTVTEAWQRRLSRAFQDHSIQATMGILLGAVWGMMVPKEVWKAVCDAETIFEPESIVDMLRAEGLVWVDDHSWGFSDVNFYQACVTRARNLGEYPRLNRMYLSYLEHQNRQHSPKFVSLCVEGGAYERAVPMLLDTVRDALLRERVSESAKALQQLRQCVAGLAVPASNELVGQIELLSLDLAHGQYTPESISDLNDWFVRAETYGWNRLLGMGHRLMGQMRRWAGEHSASNTSYQRALALAEGAEDIVEVSLCVYGLGVNARAVGDYERAIQLLQRVIDNEAAHPELPLNLFARSAMAACHMGLGHYDLAKQSFQDAGVTAEQLGYQNLVADALMGQGEIEKLEGKHTQARVFYERAQSTVSILSYARRAIIELNLCTLLMAEQQWTTAGERLQPLLAQCRHLGLEQPALCIEVFLLPFWVGRKTEDQWVTHFEHIQQQVTRAQLADKDLGLAYEATLKRLQSIGWSNKRSEVYDAACTQWRQLNKVAELHALQVRYNATIDCSEES